MATDIVPGIHIRVIAAREVEHEEPPARAATFRRRRTLSPGNAVASDTSIFLFTDLEGSTRLIWMLPGLPDNTVEQGRVVILRIKLARDSEVFGRPFPLAKLRQRARQPHMGARVRRVALYWTRAI